MILVARIWTDVWTDPRACLHSVTRKDLVPTGNQTSDRQSHTRRLVRTPTDLLQVYSL
jgi:hypothetical protein